MNIQQVKEIISDADFSDETRVEIEKILAQAEQSGGIEKEQKDKILAIIDLEVEAITLQADALEDAADAFAGFADSVERSVDKGGKELVEVERNLTKT